MNKKYTCNEYREEMILVGLRKRLATAKLTAEEQKKLLEEIKKLEKNMGL